MAELALASQLQVSGLKKFISVQSLATFLQMGDGRHEWLADQQQKSQVAEAYQRMDHIERIWICHWKLRFSVGNTPGSLRETHC